MTGKLFLEGGGDSKELRSRCREGFRRLLEQAGLEGRMPRLVASGSRSSAFGDFSRAHTEGQAGFVAMLIDSEEPVANVDAPWAHLRSRDNWPRPNGASEDQALLMITSMETWIAADRACLQEYFGQGFRIDALPSGATIEARSRQDVLHALEQATRACKVRYAKGKVSFEVIGRLTPVALGVLRGFARAVRILRARL